MNKNNNYFQTKEKVINPEYKSQHTSNYCASESRLIPHLFCLVEVDLFHFFCLVEAEKKIIFSCLVNVV